MFVTPGWAQESHSESAAPAEGEAHGSASGDAHTEVPGEKGVFPPFDPSTFPSQLLWLAIMNIEDKRARERAKESADNIPHGQRKAKARLVEGAVIQGWKAALSELALVYPERIAAHL